MSCSELWFDLRRPQQSKSKLGLSGDGRPMRKGPANPETIDSNRGDCETTRFQFHSQQGTQVMAKKSAVRKRVERDDLGANKNAEQQEVVKSPDRVVLIYGDSGHGKSYFAAKLKNEFGYRMIAVDNVYIQFIRDRFPDLYFPRLRHFIWNHWHNILFGGYDPWIGAISTNPPQFSPVLSDVLAVWRNHLYDVIEDELLRFPSVVVEGYLLNPAGCREPTPLDELKRTLGKKAVVRNINVVNRKCLMEGVEIAAEAFDWANLGHAAQAPK